MLGLNRIGVTATVVVLVGIAGLLYTFASAAPPVAAAAPDEPKARVEFTADGNLKQPEGYREWIYIGTPLTPNELNNGEARFNEFHNVYIDPDSFAHFQKSGEFRDGTIIIKELVRVGTKEASSGKGYFMGDFAGLESSIKDSKRFKDEPGNWAYFSFGERKYPLKKETGKESATDCNSCHQSSADTDYVFSQYYPVLRAAMPHAK